MAISQSTERIAYRMQARNEAGINEDLAMGLENLDALCGEKAEFAENLCRAIQRLVEVESGQNVDRMMLASLARQASYWTADLGNEVNGFMEKLGCNHVCEVKQGATNE